MNTGLVYITGVPGTGKTTTCEELADRGYKAFDTDADGMKSWYEVKSGKRSVDQPGWDDASEEFKNRNNLKNHRFKIEELSKLSEHGLVFLCGSTFNDKEIMDLFDLVIILTVPGDILRHRLLTRTNNSYGKVKGELEKILGWHAESSGYKDWYGREKIEVNSDKDVVHVVDDILKVVQKA
jgi:broad-specificity NMP kinase